MLAQGRFRPRQVAERLFGLHAVPAPADLAQPLLYSCQSVARGLALSSWSPTPVSSRLPRGRRSPTGQGSTRRRDRRLADKPALGETRLPVPSRSYVAETSNHSRRRP